VLLTILEQKLLFMGITGHVATDGGGTGGNPSFSRGATKVGAIFAGV
jgi:hypothetical protein